MKYILFAVLTTVFSRALGQSTFPSIEVEKLSGKEVLLPSDLDSPYSLVGLALSKKAEEDLRTWQNPVYNKFIAKTGLMDEMFNVDVLFIPVFTGANKMAKGKVIKKLKENNESLVFDNLYIYSGSKEPFSEIGVDENSEPYFLLMDKAGKILWRAAGTFRQSHLDEIEEILMQ
jgi:hypothetical protein